MKKIQFSLLLAFILLISKGFAQSTSYYYNDYNLFHVNTKPNYNYYGVDSFALKLGIKNYTILSTYFGKKGKKYSSLAEVNFDNKGHKIKQLDYVDTNKTKIGYSLEFNFNEKQLCTYESYHFYKFNTQVFYTYNDSNKVNSKYYYDKKNQLSTKSIYEYNLNGKLEKIINTNKKQKKISEYQYTYYPNNELKQTALLNKKGKVNRVWDYTCDASGKPVKKTTDTAKICTTKTYRPDGTIISTTQSYNWDGKPYKRIVILNVKNQILENKYLTGINDHLENQTIYTYNIYGNLSSRIINYYKKGKLNYNSSQEYDNSGRTIKDISTNYKAKKLEVKTFTYQYNFDGLITQKQELKNGKLKKYFTYKYCYF